MERFNIGGVIVEEKYLPIGTVVRLKEGKKNLMIIGFAASSKDSGDKIFDYMGSFYPEGVFTTEMNFLFNHDQIEEILFKGFVNDEENKFKKILNEFLTNGTIDGQVPNFEGLGNLSSNVNNELSSVKNQNFSQPQMFTSNDN